LLRFRMCSSSPAYMTLHHNCSDDTGFKPGYAGLLVFQQVLPEVIYGRAIGMVRSVGGNARGRSGRRRDAVFMPYPSENHRRHREGRCRNEDNGHHNLGGLKRDGVSPSNQPYPLCHRCKEHEPDVSGMGLGDDHQPQQGRTMAKICGRGLEPRDQ
jgi:hypothetical protein